MTEPEHPETLLAELENYAYDIRMDWSEFDGRSLNSYIERWTARMREALKGRVKLMAYDNRPSKVRFADPETVFEHELRKIGDPVVKKAVLHMLKVAPEEFFHGPSSYSGKYHSADEFSMGGNVLHTKRVFRALMVIEDAFYERFKPFDNPQYVRDCLLAAALVHDTLQGSTGSSDHVSSFVNYYRTTVNLPDTEPMKKAVLDIAEIAQHHMGRWSPKELVPVEYEWVGWAIHTADMIATKFDHLQILKDKDYEIRP